jgi:hypothetical protein
MNAIQLRSGHIVWLLAAVALGASGPACGACTGSGTTNCQVSAHAEASLVYLVAKTVSSSVAGEDSGQNLHSEHRPSTSMSPPTREAIQKEIS